MYRRIAIHFAGRGLKDTGLDSFGESQHVDGSMHTGLRRLYRIKLVMNGRCGTCQIIDFICLNIKRKGDVMPDKFKIRIIQIRMDVPLRAGKKIVQTNHFITIVQQTLAEM
jgi:hypothetical protein